MPAPASALPTDRWRLGGVLVMVAATSVLLTALGQLLAVPSGWQVEDFLGFTDTGAVQAMRWWWQQHLGGAALWVSVGYLVADIGLYMPLYGLAFAALWHHMHRAWAAHSSKDPKWADWMPRVGGGLLIALLVIDAVENTAGLQRMAEPGAELSVLAGSLVVALSLAAGTLVLLRRICDRTWLEEVLASAWPGPRTSKSASRTPSMAAPVTIETPAASGMRAFSLAANMRRMAQWLPLLLVLVLCALYLWKFSDGCGTAAGGSAPPLLWLLGCHAHGLKKIFVLGLLLAPAALGVWLLFGPHADDSRWARIVGIRQAIGAAIGRSRYVLLVLAACTALMLVMDQGRDVVYATASFPWHMVASANAEALELSIPRLAIALVAFVITALATWLLCFACWTWTRLVLQVSQRQPMPVASTPPAGDERRVGARRIDLRRKADVSATRSPLEHRIARDWARLLGCAPALLLLAMTLAGLPQAVLLTNKWPMALLLAFAAGVALQAIGFVWRRDTLSNQPGVGRHLDGYFDALPLAEATAQTAGHDPRFRGPLGISPRWLPVVALLLALLCRAVPLLFPGEPLPSLALPIVFFLLCFWLSLAGWLSLFEVSEAVPWYLLLLVLMGLLGALGLTENHSVPLAGSALMAQEPLWALAFTTALGLVLLLSMRALRGLMGNAYTGGFDAGVQKQVWIGLAVGLMVLLAVLSLADKVTTRLAQGNQGTAVAPAAPKALPDAMEGWITSLCGEDGQGCKSPMPVYVVAAEGGGIRSGYWTALVLARLWAQDPQQFLQRSFAMTGASGGSVGLAVFRACLVQALQAAGKQEEPPAKRLNQCIDQFGSADLLGPLVGAWFFEDALARVLPLPFCSHAGCGFFSRGLWFEQALLQATPGLGHGVLNSHAQLRNLLPASLPDGPRHAPYLLLNATWVETGERAIASELRVETAHFPGARDQLAWLGARTDLSLATAAHNSARFPFTNALGAVHASDADCAPLSLKQRGEPPSAKQSATRLCGHLADGGYLDNSSAQTADDLLRALRRCIDPAVAPAASACPHIDVAQRTRLHAVLKPQLIHIRNGVQPELKRLHDRGCQPLPQPACADILAASHEPNAVAAGLGGSTRQGQLDARHTRCSGTVRLFADTLGPLVTAINTTGIGANGRLAAARVAQPVGTANPALAELPEVSFADLPDNGPLYPLGWHLAPAAQQLMRAEANKRAQAWSQGLQAPQRAGAGGTPPTPGVASAPTVQQCRSPAVAKP